MNHEFIKIVKCVENYHICYSCSYSEIFKENECKKIIQNNIMQTSKAVSIISSASG